MTLFKKAFISEHQAVVLVLVIYTHMCTSVHTFNECSNVTQSVCVILNEAAGSKGTVQNNSITRESEGVD